MLDGALEGYGGLRGEFAPGAAQGELAGGLAAAFACVCAVGLAGGPVDVALLSLRQRKTDPARFGRVLAISMDLNVAGFPLGSAASGPLLEASMALGLVFAAAACAVAGLLAYVTVR